MNDLFVYQWDFFWIRKFEDHVIKFKATFFVVIEIYTLFILLGTGVANTKLYD